MIALAALLGLILAAGGPTPKRAPRGPAIARHLVAAALDADRAWRDTVLAPVRIHAEMERVREQIALDRVHRPIAELHPLRPSSGRGIDTISRWWVNAA